MDSINQCHALRHPWSFPVSTNRRQQNNAAQQLILQFVCKNRMEFCSFLGYFCMSKWIWWNCEMVFDTQRMAAAWSNGLEYLPRPSNVPNRHNVQSKTTDLLGLFYANSKVLWRHFCVCLAWRSFVFGSWESSDVNWELFVQKDQKYWRVDKKSSASLEAVDWALSCFISSVLSSFKNSAIFVCQTKINFSNLNSVLHFKFSKWFKVRIKMRSLRYFQWMLSAF